MRPCRSAAWRAFYCIELRDDAMVVRERLCWRPPPQSSPFTALPSPFLRRAVITSAAALSGIDFSLRSRGIADQLSAHRQRGTAPSTSTGTGNTWAAPPTRRPLHSTTGLRLPGPEHRVGRPAGCSGFDQSMAFVKIPLGRGLRFRSIIGPR